MPATRKMKVRCSDRLGPDRCGWSGERPATPDPTERRCPWCHCQTVELVGRTNPNRQEAAPMSALDPAIADLLAAIRGLDERTRDLPHDTRDRERSMALAHLGGVMVSMLVHGVEPEHAATVAAAWTPAEAVMPR